MIRLILLNFIQKHHVLRISILIDILYLVVELIIFYLLSLIIKSSLREQGALLTLTQIISKSTSIGKASDKLLLALIEQCVDYRNDTDLHLCSLILILIRELIIKSEQISKILKMNLLIYMETKWIQKTNKI